MKITILIDNSPSPTSAELTGEHGLSIHIDTGEQHILCDTGATPAFIDNAHTLGIDLSAVDYAFLSHGHNDHTGGLKALLESTDIPIYLSANVFGNTFYSIRHGEPRDISTDATLYGAYTERFSPIVESRYLSSNVAAVECNIHQYARPFGNCYLKSGDTNDSFSHELSLAIIEDNQLVIISPCSHCGAANIIESCKQFTGIVAVKAFVGGLHFVESPQVGSEVGCFIEDIEKVAPHATIYTGHCTCDAAKAILSDRERVKIFKTGQIIEL
ncbi:MAG: MBL fold metallo-hydrolase [Muribaculaceae bacterium]|nr:MBL fold metallo-hydrolase [Muribaculaceae bacterium]